MDCSVGKLETSNDVGKFDTETIPVMDCSVGKFDTSNDVLETETIPVIDTVSPIETA